MAPDLFAEIGKELGQRHMKRCGQQRHIDQADVALAPLDRTDLSPMQPGMLRKVFLRPAALEPMLPYLFPKSFEKGLLVFRVARLRHNHLAWVFHVKWPG